MVVRPQFSSTWPCTTGRLTRSRACSIISWASATAMLTLAKGLPASRWSSVASSSLSQSSFNRWRRSGVDRRTSKASDGSASSGISSISSKIMSISPGNARRCSSVGESWICSRVSMALKTGAVCRASFNSSGPTSSSILSTFSRKSAVRSISTWSWAAALSKITVEPWSLGITFP